MEQNFKRLADGVHLPEDSRARIRAQITSHAEEQEGFKMQKSKTRLPRLAVALIVIAALTLTAAAAAVIVRQFRNTILVSDLSEIPAPEGDTPVAVAVSEPISEAPHTLEEILAMDDRISREAWENGEQIGGTTSSLYGGWEASECISSDPALSIRRITREEDAAEKMQYMAEDPAPLLPELTGRIQFDLTWLSEHYDALPRDNQAYVIRDADGAFVSEFFWARYGAKDGKGWIALEAVYDGTHNWGASYIVDGIYEEAYYYTTQNGYEFLITADSGMVWADCTTDHASVSLYGAYLTTQDMEQIVEYMAVSMRE